MNKFKILWIDDQEDKIAIEKNMVEDIVKSYSYEPDIEVLTTITKKDLDEDSEFFSRIKSREFDLLFIDYKLKGRMLGSNIISKIRKDNKLFVDIVFYSSDRDSLIGEVKNSFDRGILEYIDDVHIVPLDDSDFEEKIQNIILKIIGSWYNANSIKGVILSSTSIFEKKIGEIILNYYKPYEENLLEKLNEKKKNKLELTHKAWNSAFESDDIISHVIGHPEAFNWGIKKTLFNALSEYGAFEMAEDISSKLNKLFGIRNDIAHNRAKIEKGNLKIIMPNGKEKIYTEKDIFKFQTDINDVYNFLETTINVPVTA